MYYEVYIDVMFLVNFMMDVLILFSVKALMKMPGSTKRVIAGSLSDPESGYEFCGAV